MTAAAEAVAPAATDSGQPSAPPSIGSSAASTPPASSSNPADSGGIGGAAPANDQQPSATVTNLDDWRKAIAGNDEKLLSEVARFKSPEDVGKELLRQKQELSKRALSAAFPDKGTPEQQAEWRKANNVPEAGTLDAYGVKPPDGYEMSNVEQAALGEYAELMQKNNVPASIVQSTVDTFFRAQAANQQMLNELDNDLSKTWRSEFDQQHGKDSAPYLSAANALFEQAIEDGETRNMILNARLPGGGFLKSHPAFMNMMVDLALKNGFADRIEGGGQEVSGPSLQEQIREIMSWRTTNRSRYDEAMQPGGRMSRLQAAAQAKGLMDEQGRLNG